MVTQMHTKRILIFLAFAFGIPWTAALVLYLTLGATDLIKAATLANIIFVSTPAVANLATRLITREGWGRLWLLPKFRRGWAFYLAAIFLPLLAVIVGGAVFYLVFPQSYDPLFSELRKYYTAYSVAPETNPWLALMIITAVASIQWLFVNGVLSIGEEFGWRAYLLPKLVGRFSGVEPAPGGSLSAGAARKASLLIGLIWGVWHFPLILMGWSLTPNLSPAFFLMYILSTCCFSVLLCWVTLRSGSVWPASVGHGFINGTSSISAMMLKGPADMLVGPTIPGVIGTLGYLGLALVLLFSRKAFADEPEARPENKPVVVEA